MGEVSRKDLEKLYELQTKLSQIAAHAFPTRVAGVTRQQNKILFLLSKHGVMTIGELSVLLRMHSSNLSTVIDTLCKAGYVERSSGTADRRITQIRVTSQGEEITSRLTEKIVRYFEEMPGKEIRELKELMQQCVEGLDRMSVDRD